MEIIFATNNNGKLKEVKALLGHQFQLLSLEDVGFKGEIPEDYDTLEANAYQKSKFIFDRFGLPVFADDTGLEVDFLNGEPGVYSARFAGSECDSNANIKKLLDLMHGTTNRKAQFRTVISYIENNENCLFEGVVLGKILQSAKGKGGFGYDPIFSPVGSELSYAQIAIEQKNVSSHRSIAVKRLGAYLKSLKN